MSFSHGFGDDSVSVGHPIISQWAETLRELLGEKLIELVAKLGPDHPDVTEATHNRLRGVWSIDRFNAPIEWYAAQVMGVREQEVTSFHALPEALRVRADELLKRDHKPDRSEEFAEEFVNLFTTQDVSALSN